MPRQDILIEADYGELVTADNPTGRTVCDFTLLGRIDGMDNERYAYGEITVSEHFGARFPEADSLHVRIPYTAFYRELKVRLRVMTSGGDTHYLVNPADNTSWFAIRDRNGAQIRLSEYGTVDAEGRFLLVRCGGDLLLFGGTDIDLPIGAALRQNEGFLLKASPGSLYQHPTTGVGLIDFLHGNFENTGLAVRLQREFENDKMVINNAYMNSETGELLLDVTERDG